MEKLLKVRDRMKESVNKNFRHATLNFIFIIIYVNVFQLVFGMENSIVGVIFTIMMSASMVRDLTGAPVKHFLCQALLLVLMAAAACFVAAVPPLAAVPVNLAMIFLILYAYTYEYVSHIYFPYILSYLFMVFISPVPPEGLPKRLLGTAAGAAGIILYQLVNGRNRVAETAREVLTAMIDEAESCIEGILSGKEISRNPEKLRGDLCRLSKIVYERRKKVLCISDAGFAMIDSGRGLENLVLLLYEMEGPVTPGREELLRRISFQLTNFRTFMIHCGTARAVPPPRRGMSCGILWSIHCGTARAVPPPRRGMSCGILWSMRKGTPLTLPARSRFCAQGDDEAGRFYQCLQYISDHLLKMTLPEEKKSCRKTLMSFTVRLKAALHVSPVRVIYALRVSCLLTLCTLAVQLLQLPHGKWLLFTVASVSLPYADDVGAKAGKRLIATLIGGVCSVVVYSLIPTAGGRTAVMMISGYLSFYFSDYSATFACSTVGALGGAVFMGEFGWGPVGRMLLIRLGYIGAGILVALAANCLFFPFKRKTATRQLWKKYVSTTRLLSEVCRKEQADPQLYYSLVIQAHLQEDRLMQNASELNWEGAKGLLEQCRQAVRLAHRARPVTI